VLASCLVACSSSTPAASEDAGTNDATTVTDASPATDSGTDAPVTTTTDSGTDALATTTDSGADVIAPTDAGLDATSDDAGDATGE
jgi:hypothetical protein